MINSDPARHLSRSSTFRRSSTSLATRCVRSSGPAASVHLLVDDKTDMVQVVLPLRARQTAAAAPAAVDARQRSARRGRRDVLRPPAKPRVANTRAEQAADGPHERAGHRLVCTARPRRAHRRQHWCPRPDRAPEPRVRSTRTARRTSACCRRSRAWALRSRTPACSPRDPASAEGSLNSATPSLR